MVFKLYSTCRYLHLQNRRITQEKDKKYNGDVELYKIYMLKDNIWGYCKNVCEIIEVETLRADELLKHRKKNILKKINIVENALIYGL